MKKTLLGMLLGLGLMYMMLLLIAGLRWIVETCGPEAALHTCLAILFGGIGGLIGNTIHRIDN